MNKSNQNLVVSWLAIIFQRGLNNRKASIQKLTLGFFLEGAENRKQLGINFDEDFLFNIFITIFDDELYDDLTIEV
jgi:hypothetical protein